MIMNPLLKNFLLTLQRRLMPGRLVSVDDLPRSNSVLHHAATLHQVRGYEFHQVQDTGVILSKRRMHFLDVRIPARPEIVGSVETRYDPCYGNNFLGFLGNYALVTIAYDGVEVFDIRDLKTPKSLLLTKEYGTAPLRMHFHSDLGVTEKAIFDVSDPMKPELLLQYKEPRWYFEVVGDNLIFTSEEGIHSVILDEEGGFPESSTLDHKVVRRARLHRLGERHLVAVSYDGVSVLELHSGGRAFKLHGTIRTAVMPDCSAVSQHSVFARTLPYLGDTILCLDMRNHRKPERVCALRIGPHFWFAANERYVICWGPVASDPRRGFRVFAMKQLPRTRLAFVGNIEVAGFPHLWLLDNVFYLATKEGLMVYEIS